MTEFSPGEKVEDHARLLEYYEKRHLSDPLPEHEPDRYQCAEGLWKSVMQKQKSQGLVGIYNEDDVERAKRNIQELPWAEKMYDEILRDADFWMQFSDELLYAMVPTQNPMALTVAQYDGCPIHGGNRSTHVGDLLRPYQWRCELGGEWWYNGIEIENPETGEQLSMVDEGPGWIAPAGFVNEGVTHYFEGAYRAFILYRLFSSPYASQTGEGHQGRAAAQALALAYVLTGDSKYAHKAGILLNRVAEVYGRLQGIKEGADQYDKSKDPIRGYVGEASGREQGFLNSVLLTYDLVFDAIRDDKEIVEFFEQRGGADYDGDGSATTDDILFNIHRNLFSYAYEFLDRTLPLAGGDFLTSSLYCLMKVGACLQNGAMIHQALNAPTGLYNVMCNSFFRDGKFWYDSIGYCTGNASQALDGAEWTYGFSDGEHFVEPMDLYHNSRYLVREPMDFVNRTDCDGQRPLIGDTGGGRNRNIRSAYSLADEMGYLRLPDEREACARRILAGSNGDPDRAREGGELYLLFHATRWQYRELNQISGRKDVINFCFLALT